MDVLSDTPPSRLAEMAALARVGRWDQARAHVEQLRSIERHLSDGRHTATLTSHADIEHYQLLFDP
jgi:hypothetical protein